VAGGRAAVAAIVTARPGVVPGLLFEARIWGALGAALCGARLVVSEHGLAEYPGWHGRVFGWVARSASACVVSSQAAADHIRRRYGVPAAAIQVVPNAVPPSCWAHGWQPPPHRRPPPTARGRGPPHHPTTG